MSGLAGFVQGELERGDPAEKLVRFREVNRISGVPVVEQSWCGLRCALFNAQTGHLHHHSEKHAWDSDEKIHILLEGEVINEAQVAKEAEIQIARLERSFLHALIRLFLRDGPSFIRRVKGEFALVVYEETLNRLHLFTDHWSTKSLFFLTNRQGLLFASEKKSILAACGTLVSVDPVGVLELLSMQHNLADRTVIADIKRLPPASHLCFATGETAIKPYQGFAFHDAYEGVPAAKLVDRWGELLIKATLARLSGKRRLMLFLSGGLDSRAVACATPREIRPTWARTHGDKDSAEVRVASEIARELGFSHYVDALNRPFLTQVLEAIVWRTECEIPYTSALSIGDHPNIARRADFIVAGQFGDVGSGGHIRPYMLLAQPRGRFLEEVFERYLLHPLPVLQKILRRDFLEAFYPAFKESFLRSFEPLASQRSNVEIFELWEMMHRLPRYIFSSQKIDSHRFEAVMPLADADYVQFALGLPTHLRFKQPLYQSVILSLGQELRRVPYANTLQPLRPYALMNRSSVLCFRCWDSLGQRFYRWKYKTSRSRMGPQLTLDGDLRDRMASSHVNSDIFDWGKLRRMFEASDSHGPKSPRLLAMVVTVGTALPMFLEAKVDRCPTEAVPYLSAT